MAIFYSRWVSYLESVEPASLQPECRPRLIEPSGNVPYRGTVVLLHGFTACPQQFFELAELLALQGYRSLLVVLPGHGRQLESHGGDDSGDLPVPRNWQKEFTLLAVQINGIMEYADGDRVIGGLSAGATASLFVNMQAPQLYDRHLLLAPLFALNDDMVAGAPADETSEAATNMSFMRAGEACVEKRAQGRAGYCNYEPKHLDAVAEMGAYTFDTLRQTPLAVTLQLVGVESDTVVSNARIREFLDSQAETTRTSACFFPVGVPHDLISEYDFPGIEMFWLDSLLNGSIGFIVTGRVLPVIAEVSVSDAPYPVCAMETERRD